MAPLISSIIHDHRDWRGEPKPSDFFQEFAHACRIDVAVVGHRDELVSDGVERPQHIEPLPSARSPDHDTDEAPEKAKIGSQDKMSTIDKKDGSRSRFRLF